MSEDMLIEDDHICPINVRLSSPSMTRDDIDMDAWEATINVNLITPRDRDLRCLDVRVAIKSSEGLLMEELVEPLPEDLTGNSQNNDIVQIWISDNNNNNRLDPGDVIRISGLTTDHEGATVQILNLTEGSGKLVADLTLPSEFSESN